MFELLSLVFGGLIRLVPEGMKLWGQSKEREHEREMLKLQMMADEKRAELEMKKIQVQGEITMSAAELQGIIEATKAQAAPMMKTGNAFLDTLIVWVEVLSATVRPVLTYWYCVVGYGAYKTATYYLLIHHGAPWEKAIFQLWLPQDFQIMMSIIGFWFVDRAIRKMQ